MSLPFSRNTDYSTSTPILPPDLDALQDVVISHERNKLKWMSYILGDLSGTAARPDFGGDSGPLPSALWAYCVSPGRAFLRQGSANNKIQIAPGALLQSDGGGDNLLGFPFQGTEEFTLTNGDVTNPRVDLLEMKIAFDPSVGPSVTLQVKAGTPAASPTVPDPDAGFVPVATAVVGHGWTTAGAAPIFGVDTAEINNVVIHDQRMPMTIRKWVTDPVLYKLETAWALSNTNTSITSSNAANSAWIRCPTNMGRVVCIDLYTGGVAVPISAATLRRAPAVFSAGFQATSNGFGANVAADTTLYNRSRRQDFEALHTPAAGPTILASAVNKIGVPLWASGYRVPGVPNTIPEFAFVKVTNANNLVTLGETIWYVAA